MDYIGLLVKKFESGNKGSLDLGQSGYDWGLSCGSWQLTLRYGNCIKFLKKHFPKEAESLFFNEKKKDIKLKFWPGRSYCSGPKEVKEIWNKCYKIAGAKQFLLYEHEYIKSQYYDKIKKRIKINIDLDKTCRAFQELFWSWSVNLGVSGAEKAFNRVLEKLDYKIFSFEELFDACYDDRYQKKGTNRYKKGLVNGDSEREVLRPYLVKNGIEVDEVTSPLISHKRKDFKYKGIIVGGSVYVREGPGKQYPSVDIVRKGQEIVVISEQNGWCYAEDFGWVSMKYVKEKKY